MSKTTTTTIKTTDLYRAAPLETLSRESRGGSGGELDGFKIVFSTEAAQVVREFWIDDELVRGLEVLSHEPGAADLSFLSSGRAPLLADHRHEKQVGVIDAARIDGRQGVGEGRFSRSERARDDVQDVKDGIRRNTSVGYVINEMRVDPPVADGGLPIFRVTKWRPFEVSILSVPADQVGSTIEARTGSNAQTTTVRKAIMTEPTTETRTQPPIEITRPSSADEEKRIRRETQEAERGRVNFIRELGAKHHRTDLADASIRAGHPVELFKGIMLDVLGDQVPLETPAAHLGMSKREQKDFSFVRALEFMAMDQPDQRARDKAGFEIECSHAVGDALGKQARGLFVPQDMLESDFSAKTIGKVAARNAGPQTRNLTVGTATAGGNLVGTDHLGSSFIEVLYNSMQVRNMGARVLSGLRGNVQIPRRTAGGGTRWTAEQAAAVTGSDLNIGDSTFDQVSLTPRELTTTSLMTRRLIQQSDPSIETLVRSDLAMAVGLAVDSAAISGDNTTDPNMPDGILNAAGTNVVSLGTPDGGAMTYAQAVEFIRVVMASNALGVGSLGWLMNANGWARGMTVSRDAGSGQFLIRDGRFVEHPFAISEQVPSNLVEGASGAVLNAIIFAAWSSLMIGEWGVLELQVDPYSAVATGAIRVNAFMTMDIALRYPQAFAFSADMI